VVLRMETERTRSALPALGVMIATMSMVIADAVCVSLFGMCICSI
jgi:hypothetical protein